MYIVCWHIGVDFLKACPFCGDKVPEEAIYCLNCSSVLNERQILPVVQIKVKNKRKKAIAVIPRKKFMGIIAIVLSVVIIFTSCFFAIKSTKNDEPSKENPGTTLSPITEENGENVTNENGEQIFEVIEVTDTTTEKQGFLDKLFGKDETETETKSNGTSETKPETTTKKQSLLDKLFGDDEEKGSSPSTNKPETTTKKQSSVDKPTNESEKTTNSSTSVIEPEATTNPEITTNKVENSTTTKETTTNETDTSSSTSTTESTTISSSQSNVEDFEYVEYSSNKMHLSITKYNGNAENVVIPATYDGKYIVEKKKETFKDNDKVKTVTFADDEDRPYLWINGHCFYNCPNLHTINMPDENLGIHAGFAQKCYSMKTITLKNSQYRFDNGGLYASNGKLWELRYMCPASAPETFNIPSWSSGIDTASNLKECSNLRVIYCHEYVTIFPHQSIVPSNLEAIYVDDANQNGYDINGIAFKLNSSDGRYICTYPPKNTTKDFTLPNNSLLYSQYVKNPYLETLRIEQTADLFSPTYIASKWAFTNLKTIYIKSGHKNEATIKKDFYGTVYTY